MATATGTTATRLDLTLQPGATLKFSIDDLEGTDISGATAKMEIRSKDRFPVLLVTLTDGDGIVLGGSPPGVSGAIMVILSASQTAAILENARYDLLLTYSDGTIDKLRVGALTRVVPVTT